MHASLEVLRFDTLQSIQNVIAIETSDILVTVISNTFSRKNIIVFWYNISDPVFALTMMAMIYELNILILLSSKLVNVSLYEYMLPWNNDTRPYIHPHQTKR